MNDEDVPITVCVGHVTATDPLDDLFGFEAAQKRQQIEELTEKNGKLQFAPWRVFINHIDSYHGEILADILSDTIYVDPLSTRADQEDQELEEEDATEAEVEEEREEERKRTDKSEAEASRKYQVIGTVLDCKHPLPEDVIVIKKDPKDYEHFLFRLMSCGIIIYDITQESNQISEACNVLKDIIHALEEKQEKSPKAFEREEPVRHFILISTIMTWAHTKPLDPADPDLPFTEADYRKRKPHPNYKEHLRCEREVTMVKKIANLRSKLRTLVICCGITYGEKEGLLHYLFKMAWQNAPFLPVFGKGRNKIPLLHVRDLAAVISSVLQNWPPIRYIVAVEQELISQDALVKEISRILTTGKIKNISEEEVRIIPTISRQAYEHMNIDLNIDPVYIVDRIRWHYDLPFRHITESIIKEYKTTRNLFPVKIIVLGPPASGKTRVARYLERHYEIHYIHVDKLIRDTIQRLINDIEAAELAGEQRTDDLRDTAADRGEDNANQEEEETEERVEGELVADVADLREQLQEIRMNIADNGRLDDTMLNKLFLARLRSKDCLNQGYVMDGYPKTLEQAKKLFLVSRDFEEEEEEEYREDIELGDVDILPELVVVLEASDEFLKERVMNLPESEIQNTHYTEEHMLRRLREYRERNTDENTPLQLFDEMEIHLLVVSVETDICRDMFPTVYQCLEKLGKPRNYGLTAEEISEARIRIEVEKRAFKAAEKLRKQREMFERKKEREKKMIEWTHLMEKLKQEEEEKLYILAEPLQRYLAMHVLPTLTEGLIEVAKLRPDDPVDFLAEYLFKKNPEGRMFEPDYTETLSMLLETIQLQMEDVLPETGLDDDLVQILQPEELSVSDISSEIIMKDVCKEKPPPVLIPEEIAEYEIDEIEKEEWMLSEQSNDEDKA